MSNVLKVQSLTGGYHGTNVLFDISLELKSGSVLGILGRNGVGKTTLARLIQGALAPSSGDLLLHDQNITMLPVWTRRAMGLGYMPQTQMVFDDLTVWQNLTLGAYRQAPEVYFEAFPRLAERRDQIAGSMSGGERKILAFVRTMIENTDVLVLDEPSEGVQPENIALMAEAIRARAKDGAAILLIEQNIHFLTQVMDHVIGIDAGRVTLDGAASDVSSSQIHDVLSL